MVMAKIKLGALVSDVRGSIGGMCFQGSSNGLILKTKKMRGKTNSVGGNRSRLYFSYLSNTWASMSVADKARWDEIAQVTPWPSNKPSAAKISGRMYFISRGMLAYKRWGSQYPVPASTGPLFFDPPSVNPSLYYEAPYVMLRLNPGDSDTRYRIFIASSLPMSRAKTVNQVYFSQLVTSLVFTGGTFFSYFLNLAYNVQIQPSQFVWVRFMLTHRDSQQVYSLRYYLLQSPSTYS